MILILCLDMVSLQPSSTTLFGCPFLSLHLKAPSSATQDLHDARALDSNANVHEAALRIIILVWRKLWHLQTYSGKSARVAARHEGRPTPPIQSLGTMATYQAWI